ncbi:MAG: O-antigen ligase family protein, partial [Elusimicrobia bacterium]|nr:O-antigen ligase family protein [Elusimicrobiota bacterium]
MSEAQVQISGSVPLGQRAAGLLLLACLFSGFLAGGLRDPLLAAGALCVLWLTIGLADGRAMIGLRHWLPFLAWVGLSLLASPQPLTGLPALSRWAALAVFFSAAAGLWGGRERRAWFWGLGACGVTLAACAVFVDVPGYPRVGIMPPYYNYTVFVEAALAAAALAAWLGPDGPKGAWRWLCAAFAVVAAAEIVWARSRGGLAALAVAGGFCLWRRYGRGSWPLLLAGALALGGGAFWATRAKASVGNSFKRPQIWAAAALCALEHPVLGAGPGEFPNAFLRHNFRAGYGFSNYRARADHAHSEPLEAAAELGLPGLVLLLAALVACLRPAFAGGGDWTREAGLAAFCAMATHILGDNMLHLPALALLFASALAVAAGPGTAASPVRNWPAWAGLTLAACAWIPGALSGRWEKAARTSEPPRRLELAMKRARLAPADPYARENLAWAWLEQRPPRRDEALRQLELAQGLSPFNAPDPAP